ncbi:hypothetical protein ACSBR2_030602 [Camellia fascicularis]
MEGRKWEELNMDCLVNVLGRVGIESLILDIPFVCKSWSKATLSSLCCDRCATYLSLPNRSLTDEALIYVADRCPDLRVLLLPHYLPSDHML